MSAVGVQRRQPRQIRSRETVGRILAATEELILAGGIEAATTRTIGQRAGVGPASLYRFFADREEIFAALLQRELTKLEAEIEQRETALLATTTHGFIAAQLEMFVSFHECNPLFVRLWFGGRLTPGIVARVHAYNRVLADRAARRLTAARLLDAERAKQATPILVEVADRILELAFRDRPTADSEVITTGIAMLAAYLDSAIARET